MPLIFAQVHQIEAVHLLVEVRLHQKRTGLVC